jgi:hypothetical protein
VEPGVDREDALEPAVPLDIGVDGRELLGELGAAGHVGEVDGLSGGLIAFLRARRSAVDVELARGGDEADRVAAVHQPEEIAGWPSG